MMGNEETEVCANLKCFSCDLVVARKHSFTVDLCAFYECSMGLTFYITDRAPAPG